MLCAITHSCDKQKVINFFLTVSVFLCVEGGREGGREGASERASEGEMLFT